MAWPLTDDYRQALQNANNSLIPAQLKAVRFKTDKLGRPWAKSGAFAAVFEITDTGGTRWALRCFIKTVPDGQQRYQAIDQALRAAALPYFVQFEYIERGLLISGKEYPIIKMEWLDGEPFAAYVERNHSNSAQMRHLSEQIYIMVRNLERQGLAHGDLSGDNLRVVGGQVKLLDYDGIYSQRLQGLKPPTEVGTGNFRHPYRHKKPFFGPTMDRFSALLCITSLHSLSVDPSLWRFGAQDRLIFREEDLLAPGQSAVFGALLHHANAEVRYLSSMLAQWCLKDPADMPELPPIAAVPSKATNASRPQVPLPNRSGSQIVRQWRTLPKLLALRKEKTIMGVLVVGLVMSIGLSVTNIRSAQEDIVPASSPEPAIINGTSGATQQKPPQKKPPQKKPPQKKPPQKKPPQTFQSIEELKRRVENALREVSGALERKDVHKANAAFEIAQQEFELYRAGGGDTRAFARTMNGHAQQLRRLLVEQFKQQFMAIVRQNNNPNGPNGTYVLAFNRLSALLVHIKTSKTLSAQGAEPLRAQIESEMARIEKACRAEAVVSRRREETVQPCPE